MQKKWGFTLAEVLIVLAVIGIIAALTIPTLMASWREQATVTRVKKAYSTLSQAYELIMVKSGEDAIMNILKNSSNADPVGSKQVADLFLANMRGAETLPAAAAALLTGPLSLDGDPTHFYYDGRTGISLADGTVVLFYINAANCTPKQACVSMQVFLEPQKQQHYGIDAFVFYINHTSLLPLGGEEEIHHYAQSCVKGVHTEHNGYGCAYWIITQGNMDYLH